MSTPILEYTVRVKIIDETHLTYQALRKIDKLEVITAYDVADQNLVKTSQMLIFRLSETYGNRSVNMGFFDAPLKDAYPGNNKILKNVY